MVERFQPKAQAKPAQAKAKEKPEKVGDYFTRKNLRFISTGCTLLDCVLAGGWPLGRVSNVVGDKSVGKTLLAIEAAANLARDNPKAHIWYREAEAAFDMDYATRLGLPVDRVDFGDKGVETQWDTVEDIFEDLEKCLAKAERTNKPGLYIVDSLDALSSRAELKRKVSDASYGQEKPKLMSELFRRHIRRIRSSQVHVMFISQVRDAIGVMFGDKHTRSGGRALDFYSAQILWLAHIQTLTREIRGIKKATGVKVRAKAKKNKIGPPFGECEFPIRFGYGVDDLVASIDWLEKAKRLKLLGVPEKGGDAWIKQTEEATPAERAGRLEDLRGAIVASWREVEGEFLPKRQKYEVLT